MMILTEKQTAALKKFSDGSLLSAQALVKLLGIIKPEAANRIAELRDKGALRKMNQTQYGITKKGLEALGLLADAKPVTKLERVIGDDERPLTDAEMDRLLDGAVAEAADDDHGFDVLGPHEDHDHNHAFLVPPVDLLPGVEVPPPAEPYKLPAQAETEALCEALRRPKTEVEAISLPHNHPAIQAIERLKEQLNSPRPVRIDDLDLKREVLINLAMIMEQSITDVLVGIADDLDRAAGIKI